VELTNKEAEIFSKFEEEILYSNGLMNISGGFASIIVDDEEEGELTCIAKCGVQNDCENNVDTWLLKFNRQKLAFMD
jgi:hypothetical protein